VWPGGFPETFCVDHWRCRFKAQKPLSGKTALLELLQTLASKNIDFIKTEHLYNFDGKPGYSMGQGE
jgi:isocitrate dehydrogenase